MGSLLSLLVAASIEAATPFPKTASSTAVESRFEHIPVDCIVDGMNARLCARIASAGLESARIYFGDARSSDRYYVEMTPEAAEYCATLPRPLGATIAVRYSVVAVHADTGNTSTGDVWASVSSPEECSTAVDGDPERIGSIAVFDASTGTTAAAPNGFRVEAIGAARSADEGASEGRVLAPSEKVSLLGDCRSGYREACSKLARWLDPNKDQSVLAEIAKVETDGRIRLALAKKLTAATARKLAGAIDSPSVSTGVLALVLADKLCEQNGNGTQEDMLPTSPALLVPHGGVGGDPWLEEKAGLLMGGSADEPALIRGVICVTSQGESLAYWDNSGRRGGATLVSIPNYSWSVRLLRWPSGTKVASRHFGAKAPDIVDTSVARVTRLGPSLVELEEWLRHLVPEYEQGVAHMAGGRWAAAIAAFQKAVAARPDLADAYFHLGTLLPGENRDAEAEFFLEKYLSLKPDNAGKVAAAQAKLAALKAKR